VLDYYHCKEYLHKVAKVQYESSERALEWVEATLTRLSLGKVGWVLGGLRPGQAHLKREWVSLYGDRVLCNQNPFVPRGCTLWVCSQRHRFRTILPR
jgi:hypothetical protein